MPRWGHDRRQRRRSRAVPRRAARHRPGRRAAPRHPVPRHRRARGDAVRGSRGLDGVLAVRRVRRRRGLRLARRRDRLRLERDAARPARPHPRERDVPGRRSRQRRGGARPLPRMPHGEGQGRRDPTRRSRTTSRACAPCARRSGPRAASGSTPTAAGTSTRPSTPSTRSPSSTSSTSSSRARPSPSSPSSATAPSTWASRSPRTRASGERMTRWRSPRPAPPTSS